MIAFSGATSVGLSTTVQPAASAGATLHMIWLTGQFHGVIRPQTPIGSRADQRRAAQLFELVALEDLDHLVQVARCRSQPARPSRARTDAPISWEMVFARSRVALLVRRRDLLEQREALLAAGLREGLEGARARPDGGVHVLRRRPARCARSTARSRDRSRRRGAARIGLDPAAVDVELETILHGFLRKSAGGHAVSLGDAGLAPLVLAPRYHRDPNLRGRFAA